MFGIETWKLVVGAVVIVVGTIGTVYWWRLRARIWREVCERLLLQPAGRGRKGRSGPYAVVVTDKHQRHGPNDSLISVAASCYPPQLTLGQEGTLSKLAGADVQIGERTFDAHARIKGSEAQALAVLDQSTRAALRRWRGFRLSGGVLRLVTDEQHLVDPLTDAVKRALELARALSLERGGIAGRLADNVASDDVAPVRRRNLEVLIADYGRSTPARKTIERALDDIEPTIRLDAARAAGPAGCSTLSELAVGQHAPAFVRAEALTLLAEGCPDAVAAAVAATLDSPHGQVRCAAIRAAGTARCGGLVERLVALAAGADDDTGIALAEALGALADPRAEAALIGFLGAGDASLRAAAVPALAAAGTIAAVEPLLGVSGRLRGAAREAITRIQERVGPTERGGLSLADDPGSAGAGALSVAGDVGEPGLAEDD